jgi:hypothetical protein
MEPVSWSWPLSFGRPTVNLKSSLSSASHTFCSDAWKHGKLCLRFKLRLFPKAETALQGRTSGLCVAVLSVQWISLKSEPLLTWTLDGEHLKLILSSTCFQFSGWGTLNVSIHFKQKCLSNLVNAHLYVMDPLLFDFYCIIPRYGPLATGWTTRGTGFRVPVGSTIFTSPYRPDRLWGPPNFL